MNKKQDNKWQVFTNMCDTSARRAATMLLLTLLAFILLPQNVMADDLPRIDDPSYYTIENYGGGTVHIKMPLYNKAGTDRWVSSSTIST